MRAAVVIGTRPEAIKMAPVLRTLQRHTEPPLLIATAQHRELLDQVFSMFSLKADVDLNIMRHGQRPEEVVARILPLLGEELRRLQPDVVLVHGDTITTFAASLAAYLNKIPVGHVEAGLRTFDKWSPFPEEMNRSLTGVLADIHFAPTARARENLLREGRPSSSIVVTGNTVVDAVQWALQRLQEEPNLGQLPFSLPSEKRIVVVTCHRRESFGAPLASILRALRRLVLDNDDIALVFPVHPNPNVEGPVREALGSLPRVHLISPLEYFPFVSLLSRASLLLTDSGGLQEEAPALKKPTLVLREVTERPEVLEAGCARLVGTDEAVIVREAERLLRDHSAWQEMSDMQNPFGDGHAATYIAKHLQAVFG